MLSVPHSPENKGKRKEKQSLTAALGLMGWEEDSYEKAEEAEG